MAISKINKFELLTASDFCDLKERFIETAVFTCQEKDIDVFNIMTKQGVFFNEYQFIELFLDGRMKGQTTLEVFILIKDMLKKKKGESCIKDIFDKDGYRAALHKMDMLIKYISENFYNHIEIGFVRREGMPQILLTRL